MSIAYQKAHINQTDAPNLIGAVVVCVTLAWVAVGLRFTSRIAGRVPLGKDDACIVLALIFSSTFSILHAALTADGLGRHVITLNATEASIIGKGALAGLTILPMATWSVKISILLLYGRIFPTPAFRRILWAVGIFATCLCIANVFSTIFECLPVGAQLTGRPHTCINLDLAYEIFSFLNSAVDFTLLGMPMPLIWNLHTSLHRKMQITSIFSLGLLACAASLVRAVLTVTTADDNDTTYTDIPALVWSVVEVNIAIVSACLPTLRPLSTCGKERKSRYQSSLGLSARPFNAGSRTNQTQSTKATKLSSKKSEAQFDIYDGVELDTRSFVRLGSAAPSAISHGSEHQV